MAQNYRIKARGKRLELFIYEPIGAGFFEGVSAKQVADDLKAAGRVELITVFINSPGGSAFDGLTIYNQLRRHLARVEVQIDGAALSAASIVAMAGDVVRIAANGMMMIHNPRAGLADGEEEDFRTRADALAKNKTALVSTYVSRTGKDAAEIAAMMKAETWFSAEEALAAGFVDEVVEDLRVAALADVSRHWIKRAPAALVAKSPETPRKNRAKRQLGAMRIEARC